MSLKVKYSKDKGRTTGLLTTEETSDTTVRNLNCIFPYIYNTWEWESNNCAELRTWVDPATHLTSLIRRSPFS